MKKSEFKRLEDYLIIRMQCSKTFAYGYLMALHQYKIITDKQYVDLSSKITMMKGLKD